MGIFGAIKSLFGSDGLDIEKRFSTLHQANSGTMSRLLKVQEHATGTIFALKILDTQKIAEFEERFQGLHKPSEGEISLAIKHPSVVETFEFGLTSLGEHFLLMEFLDGAGLHTLIDPTGKNAKVKGSGKRLLSMLRTAAIGLGAVHKAGFVHRDVCPHNFVALKGENRCKLIDFGLSIPAAREFQLPANRTGKLDYMAPEILRRQATDHRVDVFAFGASAYQLCAGRLPWEAAPKGGLSSAARSVADIRKYRPTVAPVLATAIERCLANDPAGRFHTLEEFVREVASLESVDG